MRKKHSIELVLILLLALALSTSCFIATVHADTSILTEQELEVAPMNRTGFIYNPYSVFVYHKGESKDGIIRFTDTIHYFNTINTSVCFRFNTMTFHENRAHNIPLPYEANENYTFYVIPKTIEWVILPNTLTVESMHLGEAELNIEMNEREAYDLVENNSGGLIGLVTASPSASQNIGGTIVTSVPAYKVFIVLLPEGKEQGSSSIDGICPWIPYAIIIGIVIAIIVVLASKLEYVEVDEKVEK